MQQVTDEVVYRKELRESTVRELARNNVVVDSEIMIYKSRNDALDREFDYACYRGST